MSDDSGCPKREWFLSSRLGHPVGRLESQEGPRKAFAPAASCGFGLLLRSLVLEREFAL